MVSNSKSIFLTKPRDVSKTSEVYAMSFKNRELLEEGGNIKPCGCFYCSRVFTSDKIVKWADQGQTALCPNCSTDSVVPFLTDKHSLRIMYCAYFKARAIQPIPWLD